MNLYRFSTPSMKVPHEFRCPKPGAVGGYLAKRFSRDAIEGGSLEVAKDYANPAKGWEEYKGELELPAAKPKSELEMLREENAKLREELADARDELRLTRAANPTQPRL